MSILSCSPLSPIVEEKVFPKESPTFSALLAPLKAQLPHLTPLESGSNKPLTYTFAHLSACGHAQAGRLSKKAAKCVGRSYAELGHLVVIDGSLIGACLSMTWAAYRGDVRKAKMHLGLDLSGSIPRKMILTEGRGAERPFVSHLLKEGETGILDRGYQDHQRFDAWIEEGKHIVVRLKKNTKWEVIEALPFEKGTSTSIFFFAKVLLGDPVHRMTYPVYLVGFKSRGKTYWIATDLPAPQRGRQADRTSPQDKSPSFSRLDGKLKPSSPGGKSTSRSIISPACALHADRSPETLMASWCNCSVD